MGVERFFALAVVVGIVGVEPIAPAIDVKIGDLGEFRRLDQELLLGKQRSYERSISVSFR